jgi:hypothetical protein
MARLGVHQQRIALTGDAARLVEDLAARQGLTVPEVVRQALIRERERWENPATEELSTRIPHQPRPGNFPADRP